MRVGRHWRIGLTLAALIAATLLVTAAPSAAYMRNFQVASDHSAKNSTGAKSLEVPCPGSTFLLGGDAFVGPVFGGLAIDAAGSAPGFSSLAGAVETDPTANPWRLSGSAFCVELTSTPPTLGAAASYVKAVRIIRAHSSFGSDDASATASCPGGRKVIAGGGELKMKGGDPNPGVALTGLDRRNGGKDWRVSGHEVDRVGKQWRVAATAVCANVSTETATANYVGPSVSVFGIGSDLSSQKVQTVSGSCGANGMVVGGGARVLDSADNPVSPKDVAITRSEPAGSGPESNDWVAEARELDPIADSWHVALRVNCSAIDFGPPS